jgi:hypothetical protein
MRTSHPLHTGLGSGVREHRRTLPAIHPTNRLRGTPRETVLPGGPFYFLDGPVALVYIQLNQPELIQITRASNLSMRQKHATAHPSGSTSDAKN